MRILVALALLAMSTSASAVTIGNLYNTGVDNSKVALVANGIDQHWVNGEGAAYVSGTNGVFPVATNWLADDATSRWVTPTRNAGDSLDPTTDGIYVFSTSFSLSGFKPGTASFSGRFLSDNVVDAVFLNGTQIAGPGGSFTNWTSFSSAGAVFASDNRLVFRLRNFAMNGGNPAGLRVEFLASNVSAVPEAATWMTLVAGFGLVGAAARRRRMSSVTA